MSSSSLTNGAMKSKSMSVRRSESTGVECLSSVLIIFSAISCAVCVCAVQMTGEVQRNGCQHRVLVVRTLHLAGGSSAMAVG